MSLHRQNIWNEINVNLLEMSWNIFYAVQFSIFKLHTSINFNKKTHFLITIVVQMNGVFYNE